MPGNYHCLKAAAAATANAVAATTTTTVAQIIFLVTVSYTSLQTQCKLTETSTLFCIF